MYYVRNSLLGGLETRVERLKGTDGTRLSTGGFVPGTIIGMVSSKSLLGFCSVSEDRCDQHDIA